MGRTVGFPDLFRRVFLYGLSRPLAISSDGEDDGFGRWLAMQ